MNTKHLILTLSLTLAASAAVAALTYGYVEPVKVAPTVESTATAPPRVVVTAPKAQVAEAPVARIVVVGRRVDAGQVVAAK